MQTAETLNPDQISQFLKLGDTIEFAGQSRAERYAFAQQLLVAQEYARQGKKQRGAIRAYLSKMTGLGMAQTARLIQMYIASGAVELRGYRRHEFVSKYTDGDVRLLANVDRAHERLSGPATCCILRREYERFGKAEYARLAQISVSHLYNLRNGPLYRKHAAVYQPTRPTAVSIGERRKPNPQGRTWVVCGLAMEDSRRTGSTGGRPRAAPWPEGSRHAQVRRRSRFLASCRFGQGSLAFLAGRNASSRPGAARFQDWSEWCAELHAATDRPL